MLALGHVTGLTARAAARSRTLLLFDKRVLLRLAVDGLALRKLMADSAELRFLEFRDALPATVRSGGRSVLRRPSRVAADQSGDGLSGGSRRRSFRRPQGRARHPA